MVGTIDNSWVYRREVLWPPANTATFKIRLRYRCKTCVLEANGTEGTIHIHKNYIEKAPASSLGYSR